jgi:hypothetical protein
MFIEVREGFKCMKIVFLTFMFVAYQKKTCTSKKINKKNILLIIFYIFVPIKNHLPRV